MDQISIGNTLKKQQSFFRSGVTRDLKFRQQQLITLRDLVARYEPSILKALKADLNKPGFEAYAGEVGYIYEEVRHTLRYLKSWMKPKRVPTPLLQAIASSRVYSEPLGVVLIISPWNYPFQLVMSPLIGAIAAGNCAIVKPSEMAPETSNLVSQMIKDGMDPGLVTCVEGGAEVAQELLTKKFNHIFFTGGVSIGKMVMKSAAKNLTPVTLELGGKCPCIVDAKTDLETTGRRIAWGKFFNAGQSCVAPDYLIVDARVKVRFLEHLCKAVRDFFGPNPQKSPDYARIINRRHLDRLKKILNEGEGKVLIGGETVPEELYMAPTIIDEVSWENQIMDEEIFGPLLPVLTYTHLSEAIDLINSRPKPLAAYIFSTDRRKQEQVVKEISFGGGCVNDTLVHFSNIHLPFGGVGSSGWGAYHGKHSFETFSHRKGILKRSFLLDPSVRYPPYKKRLGFLRKLMR